MPNRASASKICEGIFEKVYMKIAIVGGGISGLTLSYLLRDKHDVEVLESKDRIGGIAFVENIDGLPYHLVGGHCFNSKSDVVLDFVFSVLPRENWNKINREANIHIFGQFLPYPIEHSIKDIYRINPELAIKITEDFVTAPGIDGFSYANLEDWFRGVFGNSLAELYFIPYNKKIWGMDLKEMSADWVSGKLPIPDKHSFLDGLFRDVCDDMVHSTFYYPKNVLKDNLLTRLAEGSNINFGYLVKKIDKSQKKFIVNDEKEFDQIILTTPLDNSIKFFVDIPPDVKSAASLLKNNKITNVMWKTSGTSATWTYFPEPSTIFHRHIHVGNFLRPKMNLTITEALGEVPYEKMIEDGARFDYLLEPLAFNTSDHAYVLHDGHKASSAKMVSGYIKSQGVHLCGRFAEWEYYNMDMCIRRAMQLASDINGYNQKRKANTTEYNL